MGLAPRALGPGRLLQKPLARGVLGPGGPSLAGGGGPLAEGLGPLAWGALPRGALGPGGPWPGGPLAPGGPWPGGEAKVTIWGYTLATLKVVWVPAIP